MGSFWFEQVAGSNCFFIEGASATHSLSVAKVEHKSHLRLPLWLNMVKLIVTFSYIQITLDSNNTQIPLFSVIWSASEDAAKYRSYFSLPEIVKFPTETGRDAYAYFYPPSNHDYQAPIDEKPPLLVKSHGMEFSCPSLEACLTSSFSFSNLRNFSVDGCNYLKWITSFFLIIYMLSYTSCWWNLLSHFSSSKQ